MPRPRNLHLLSVWAPSIEEDGDSVSGWLLRHAGLTPELVREAQERLETSVPDDQWSHEAKLRSTFVATQYRRTLVDLVESIDPSVAWCLDCLEGCACPAWEKVDLIEWSFDVRDPDEEAISDSTQEAWQRFQERQRDGWKIPVAPASVVDPVAAAAATLNLTLPTTVAAVRKAHRELCVKHHPDHGGSVERMSEINSARDTLLQSLQTP